MFTPVLGRWWRTPLPISSLSIPIVRPHPFLRSNSTSSNTENNTNNNNTTNTNNNNNNQNKKWKWIFSRRMILLSCTCGLFGVGYSKFWLEQLLWNGIDSDIKRRGDKGVSSIGVELGNLLHHLLQFRKTGALLLEQKYHPSNVLRDELSSEVGTEEKSEELLPLLFDFSVSPSACDGFASESGFEILERVMEMSNKKTNSDLGVLLPFTKVLKRLASQKNPSQLTEEQLHRLFRYTTSSIRIACEGLVTSESISSKTIPYETHKENKQRVDILLEAMKVLWILGKEKTLFKEESVEGKAEAREALYLLEDVLQILEGRFPKEVDSLLCLRVLSFLVLLAEESHEVKRILCGLPPTPPTNGDKEEGEKVRSEFDWLWKLSGWAASHEDVDLLLAITTLTKILLREEDLGRQAIGKIGFNFIFSLSSRNSSLVQAGVEEILGLIEKLEVVPKSKETGDAYVVLDNGEFLRAGD